MTESNVNDRRFWMVVAELKTGIFECIPEMCDQFEVFNLDYETADNVAKLSAPKQEYKNVYVLEAVSRYSVPEPRIEKKNLHIPPLTPRGESNE